MVTIGLPGRLSLNVPSLRSNRVRLALLVVCVAGAQTPAPSSSAPRSGRPASEAGLTSSRAGHAGFSKPRLDLRYGRRPLSFEPNVGQTDSAVDFVSRGRGYVVFLTGGEAVFALRGGAPDAEGGGGTTSVVRMQLAGT